jgi:thiazole synthase
MSLTIAGRTFTSRLLLGTGKFGSSEQLREAVLSSGTEMVTMSLKRVHRHEKDDDILSILIDIPHLQLLPNTSGVRNAKEAVFAAELAREALETNWVKLEIHPDPRYLMPDPVETLSATEILVKKGFIVLPYIHADPVLCKKLEDVGVQAVMPLGAPIGSNMGLSSLDFLRIIIEQSQVPVIVDAGIGLPSHAAHALEIGADAVLVNTAIATAKDPKIIANAFKLAVEAGRMSFESEPKGSGIATATSPMTKFLEL